MRFPVSTAACVIVLFTCDFSHAQQAQPSAEPTSAPNVSTGSDTAAERRSKPTAAEIAGWIKQLDSNRYLVRERATQSLLIAGTPATEPLLSAANSEKPEPADRAVWILRQMADSEDLDLRRTAVEQLVQVKDRPRVVAEAREVLALIEHEVAVQTIEQLGGRYLEEGDDPNWGEPLAVKRVVLDDQWQGGNEGMEHLAKLHEVPLVIIIGSEVTRPGVAQLAQLESLAVLRLYGTRLNDEDVAELRQRMPDVEIDFRRGALLGVRGMDTQGAASVVSVQPGTAAAAAGIQKNDVIRQYNGEPVVSFQDLTNKIAKNVPGDRVTIEVVRGGRPIELEVTLGRWKSR